MYNHYLAYAKPIPCPRCSTLNNQVREECRFCNCPIQNWCSDEDCETMNSPNARFCKRCGKPTNFSEYKVFDKGCCASYAEKAATYFLLFGDPNAEKYSQRNQSVYLGDFPDPPLDDDIIPYY